MAFIVKCQRPLKISILIGRLQGIGHELLSKLFRLLKFTKHSRPHLGDPEGAPPAVFNSLYPLQTATARELSLSGWLIWAATGPLVEPT